jgi:pimeloyl-ACP methyl ester carboxylesterase
MRAILARHLTRVSGRRRALDNLRAMSDVPRHDIPKRGRSGFVMNGDAQVHYLEWGHGGLPPVLCLHGGGQTAYMYEELGTALAGRAHLLAPDLPAHGDSDPLPDAVREAQMAEGIYPMHERFAETIPGLMDEFGFDRAVVVGASLGGMTAIHLAAEVAPERVSGIVLVDVGHKLEAEGVRKIVDFMTAHESFGSLEEAAEAIAEYLPQRRAPNPASLSRNLRQRPDGRWEWKHSVGRQVRERQAAGEDAPHPADHVDQITAGLGESAARVSCPVLLLRGERSDVLSEDGADDLIELIPNARMEIVEKAGHLAAGDNPHSTVSLVTGFLEDLGLDHDGWG